MAFDTYQDIFNKRGKSYHAAMELSPNARQQEFELIIAQAELEGGQTLCDMPSGGGYIQHYIHDADIDLIFIESCKEFYDLIPQSSCFQSHLGELDNLPLESNSVNTITSLAGLHHADNLPSIFSEMFRTLMKGGRLCISDVREGSSVDKFLNIFVDKHNSTGHHGTFINREFRQKIEDVGFKIIMNKPISYYWIFSSVEEMVKYCILLFGIDMASFEEVKEGIKKYLGYDEENGLCKMNWELEFVTCLK